MSDEWEEVTREELRDGDEVRMTQTGIYGDHVRGVRFTTLSDVTWERKVVKPSPEAMRAAKASLTGYYGLGIAEAELSDGEIERLARIIDKAYRGES